MKPRIDASTCRPAGRGWLLLGLGCLAALGSGCATIRSSVPPVPSWAIGHPETTRLGLALAAAEDAHPGQSGFHLLDYGLEALLARVALADAAQRTLDAQYYIYDSDEAGSILTQHLLQAADRGVRVRLLVDDYNIRDNRELAALCAHPGIQVRVFNPLPWRAEWMRLPEYLFSLHRSDHRMHNKLFVADNEVAILGGRNVGNNYFGLDTDSAFRDFDLLAAGPAARQASAAFDEFWNSEWSVPVAALTGRAPTAEDLAWLRRRVEARLSRAQGFGQRYAATGGGYLAGLEQGGGSLIWAPGQLVVEPPGKVDGDSAQTDLVAAQLEREWQEARREVLIEAAYFVPGDSGVETFRDLHQRGVAVKLLTSGREATDVPMVYAAYRGYRRALLEAGVDLYEFKLHPARISVTGKWYLRRTSYAALHSKVIVFDQRRVWIGSFNLDPRSAKLDTEIAVVVDSRELAAQLAKDIAEDLAPTRSWRLRLAPATGEPGKGTGAGAGIVWTGERDGRPVTLVREPAGWRAGFDAFLLSLVPGIEKEL